MNKRQRHRAKLQRRGKIGKLATGMRLAYERWIGSKLAGTTFADGQRRVTEAVTQFLLERVPTLGPKRARSAALCGVVLTATGVSADFTEIARWLVNELEKESNR